MTVHQCPKCELRFSWLTELEDHCRQDHPQFRHEYPVRKPAPGHQSPQSHQTQQAGDGAGKAGNPLRQ